jgi:hypothetical protein
MWGRHDTWLSPNESPPSQNADLPSASDSEGARTRGPLRREASDRDVLWLQADLAIMRHLDRLHLEFPFAGSRMLRGLLAAERSQGSRDTAGKDVPAGTTAVVRSLDAWRALERATALSTLIRQRHLTPTCGGHAPTAERTVGPARIVVESLTPRSGIRVQHRSKPVRLRQSICFEADLRRQRLRLPGSMRCAARSRAFLDLRHHRRHHGELRRDPNCGGQGLNYLIDIETR